MTFDHAALEERRILKGLSRDALATAAGISDETVRRYEKGLGSPKPANVLRLAAILDIPVADLWIRTAA